MRGLEAIRKDRQEAAQAEAARYSVAACADALGVSVPTYCAIEADPGHKLTYDRARVLADHLGCEVTDIFLPTDLNNI